jgi:TldD protein
VSVLDLLTELMGAVPSACSYAEARHVESRDERVAVRNGAVDRIDTERGEGIGVRVHVDGAWGFAATDDVSRAGAERALARAVEVALAQPRATGRAWAERLAVVAPARGDWSSPATVDPFSIDLDDKLALLLAAEAAMGTDPRLVRREAECSSSRVRQAFASTDGAACTQTITRCGGGIAALAIDGDDAQVRSYPSAHGGSVAQAGWEHLLGLGLAGEGPRVADEAIALLSAPVCPAGVRTVVLGGDQLALQVHESIGHALELDRILGGEAAYAGTSWVAAADIGSLRYGSDRVNVTADSTLPGGLGSFGWDDEGVAARRDTLIGEGVLRGVLSDRTTAAAIGLDASGGCARADGFARQPIVRMTNVSLEPGGAGSLADLLADTGDGLFLETNRSWSIDDRRLHFRFGTEVAYEIAGGELGRLYRDASYAGVTPEFWGSLDAVCSASEWRLKGLLNCGKGEPGQIMAVSHGVAPARFRDVEVGAG